MEKVPKSSPHGSRRNLAKGAGEDDAIKTRTSMLVNGEAGAVRRSRREVPSGGGSRRTMSTESLGRGGGGLRNDSTSSGVNYGLPSIYNQREQNVKLSRKELLSMMDEKGDKERAAAGYPYDRGAKARRGHATATDPDAMYQEMKSVLQRWESVEPEASGPREKAYFSSLRQLLLECVRRNTTEVVEQRVRAAYKWYLKSSIPAGLVEAPSSAVQQRWMAIVSIHNRESPSADAIKASTDIGKRSDFYSVFSKLHDNPLAPDKVKYYSASGKGAASGGNASSSGPAGTGSFGATLLQRLRTAGLRPNDEAAPSPGPLPEGDEGEEEEGVEEEEKEKAWAPGDPIPLPERSPMAQPKTPAEVEAHVGWLRGRWEHSVRENQRWMGDVRDALGRWSRHRARVEEEMYRRQEATRYVGNTVRFVNPELSLPGRGASAEPFDVNSFLTPQPGGGGTLPGIQRSASVEPPVMDAAGGVGGSGGDAGVDYGLWMSPYRDLAAARARPRTLGGSGRTPSPFYPGGHDSYTPTPTHGQQGGPRGSVGAGGGAGLMGEGSFEWNPEMENRRQLAEVGETVHALDSHGAQVNVDALATALVTPTSKSPAECMMHLPTPGDDLEYVNRGTKKKGKGKAAKGKAKKK